MTDGSVWPEVVERVVCLIEDATKHTALGRCRALVKLIAEFAVEPLLCQRRDTEHTRRATAVTRVDDLLAMRRTNMPALCRNHLKLFLVAIQRFCQLAADDANVAYSRTHAKTYDRGETCLASAMTLTSSDVFFHALCDPAVDVNARALPYVALGACFLSASWFAVDDMRRWEALAMQIMPFRYIPLRAIRTRCVAVLLTLSPRPSPPTRERTDAVVLTDVQRCYGHARLASVTAPHASTALDFYAGSLEDKLTTLSL